jgi:hypothetical protein
LHNEIEIPYRDLNVGLQKPPHFLRAITSNIPAN